MNLPEAPGADLFRIAFDLAPAGMLAVDAAGRILLANRECERLLGYGPGELHGRHVEEVVPERFRAAHPGLRAGFHQAPSERAMGSGRDLFALRRDGSQVPVEIGLGPVHTPQGVVVIATLVDISARREFERREREREERDRQSRKLESLGTLAGGIAHDFNNLLHAIVGYTEMAQHQCAGQDAVLQDLGHVLRAADRGRQLVQRILAFSRQREITRVPVRLARVTREGLDLLRASLPSAIEIRSSLSEDTPIVLADETQLQQVLLNLATNAAHAMEAGGTLDVRVGPAVPDDAVIAGHPGLTRGLHARLTVQDTGRGMPPEVLRRMFEPFYTTKPVGEGTGLGLSVVLGIVRAFEGAVAIDSAVGQGTRVDVWLPAYVEARRPEAVPAVAGEPEPSRHILFVEDEEVLAKLERRQLESLGYRVTVYTSSLEALEDFRRRPEAFDLLMTDNSMPRMSGLALAAEVTRLRPGLPVLMVSGYAENADTEVLSASGVSATLRKPHTAGELHQALSALLRP